MVPHQLEIKGSWQTKEEANLGIVSRFELILICLISVIPKVGLARCQMTLLAVLGLTNGMPQWTLAAIATKQVCDM